MLTEVICLVGLGASMAVLSWLVGSVMEDEVVGVNYRPAIVVSQTDAKFVRLEALNPQKSFQLTLSINCISNNV